MKKIYLKAVLIMIFVVLILIGIYTFSHKHLSLARNNVILSYMESSLQNEVFHSEDLEKLNDALSKEPYSPEHYFISGYQDYLDSNYEQAAENFTSAARLIEDSDPAFLKIYTYIFLNESLQAKGYSNILAENCRIALSYMSQSPQYKNNMDLCWRLTNTLLDEPEGIEQGIQLLEYYLAHTKGLSNESRVRLEGNIGRLESLVELYSEALYYYFDAFHIVATHDDVPDNLYYSNKLLICIGDIDYALEEYTSAISYYNSALWLPLDPENKGATDKALAVINVCQSYIELKQYDHAADAIKQLDLFLPILPENAKDDIEILRNHILAQILIEKKDFEGASRLLDEAVTLLESDTDAISFDKDVFVGLTYANLYKEQKQYDKALSLYEEILQKSLSRRIGLEKSLYLRIAEIYQSKNELENYSKYRELYKAELIRQNKIFTKDYVTFSEKLYEYNLLEAKEKRQQFFIIFANLIILAALLAIVLTIWYLKKWKNLSFTDPLTGLSNRTFLKYYMEKNEKRLSGKPISILMIDIDYFKKYNDNYGHIEGDRVIKEVSNTLKSCVRKNDVVIRYGGEEMVILITDIPMNATEKIAQKIQNHLAEKNIKHEYSEVSDMLTISMGIYNGEYQGENIYHLIDNADSALYHAKENGRNQYQIFSHKNSPVSAS